MKATLINHEQFDALMKSYDQHPGNAQPFGRFYLVDDSGYFVGIANEDGSAFTESFHCYEDCIDWLENYSAYEWENDSEGCLTKYYEHAKDDDGEPIFTTVDIIYESWNRVRIPMSEEQFSALNEEEKWEILDREIAERRYEPMSSAEPARFEVI